MLRMPITSGRSSVVSRELKRSVCVMIEGKNCVGFLQSYGMGRKMQNKQGTFSAHSLGKCIFVVKNKTTNYDIPPTL